MEKVAMVGAALGGLEVLTSAHYGLGLKVFELVETEGDAEFKEKIPSSEPNIYDFFDRSLYDHQINVAPPGKIISALNFFNPYIKRPVPSKVFVSNKPFVLLYISVYNIK